MNKLEILTKINEHKIILNYESIELMIRKRFKAHSIEKVLLNHTEYDINILVLVQKFVGISVFDEYIQKLFENNIVKNTDAFIGLDVKLLQLDISKYIEKYNLEITIDFVMSIISISIPSSSTKINNNHNQIIYREDVIHKFLEKNENEDVWLSILDKVCLCGDKLIFDIITKTNKKLNYQCLINACINGSKYIIEKLLDMKYIPNVECFNHAIVSHNGCKDEIVNLLLTNGLQINDDIINISIKNYYGIKNLNDYGYEDIVNVYKLCHEAQCFPLNYIEQFNKNEKIELYEKIRCNCDHKIIINIIDVNKIVVDEIMYDIAVMNNNTELIKYFEENHKMKPNIITMARIPDYSNRMAYLKRITL
jgi:hypothetical protein